MSRLRTSQQIGSWASFTPTGSWTANTTYSGFYRIVGDTLECRVNIALAGAPTSATLTVDLPSGYQIDTSKVPNISSRTPLGEMVLIDAGTNQTYGVITAPNSGTTTVNCFSLTASGTYATLNPINATTPFTFANGDLLEMTFSFPVKSA